MTKWAVVSAGELESTHTVGEKACAHLHCTGPSPRQVRARSCQASPDYLKLLPGNQPLLTTSRQNAGKLLGFSTVPFACALAHNCNELKKWSPVLSLSCLTVFFMMVLFYSLFE